MNPSLRVENLSVVYPNGYCAVRQISFELAPGESLALVGESGCGKTTIVKAALGLLPTGAIVQGSIEIDGVQTIGASRDTLRRIRGLKAGYVAQNPFSACDPLRLVGDHVAEAWRVHGFSPPAGVVVERLSELGVANASVAARLYPHQWSGGMLQRAVIASASAHRPPLIIADEPTSALDSELAETILTALQSAGAALLLITHDLQLAGRFASHRSLSERRNRRDRPRRIPSKIARTLLHPATVERRHPDI